MFRRLMIMIITFLIIILCFSFGIYLTFKFEVIIYKSTVYVYKHLQKLIEYLMNGSYKIFQAVVQNEIILENESGITLVKVSLHGTKLIWLGACVIPFLFLIYMLYFF